MTEFTPEQISRIFEEEGKAKQLEGEGKPPTENHSTHVAKRVSEEWQAAQQQTGHSLA